jgi:hypothetical protein
MVTDNGSRVGKKGEGRGVNRKGGKEKRAGEHVGNLLKRGKRSRVDVIGNGGVG